MRDHLAPCVASLRAGIAALSVSELDDLALVEDVDGGEVLLRWETGERERGEPAELLGDVDEQTFLSGYLQGSVDAGEALGTLENLHVRRAAAAAGP